MFWSFRWNFERPSSSKCWEIDRFFPPPKTQRQKSRKTPSSHPGSPRRSDLRCYIVEGSARLPGRQRVRMDPWSFFLPFWGVGVFCGSKNWKWCISGFPKCRNRHMIKNNLCNTYCIVIIYIYMYIHIYICIVNIIDRNIINLLTSEVEDTCYVVSNYKPNHIICICIPWKSTTIRKDGSFFWIMINPSFKNGSSQTKL